MTSQQNPTHPAVLNPGTRFPDGNLITASGQPTTLGSVLSGRPAVIVFYRGAWCPYCNLALAAYRDSLTVPLRDQGIALVAVSPQTPDGSLSMKEKNELDFVVLSDPGNQIATQLGIVMTPSADYQKSMRESGLHLTDINADSTAELPMPTTAIVAADGTLAWIDVHPDYTTRTDPQQILDALTTLAL